MTKVRVAIYYNGGWPHYHLISEQFYNGLLEMLNKRPWNKADIVIQELERINDA